MTVSDDLSAKLGVPSAISTTIAPSEHISTGVVYGYPSIRSGAMNRVFPTVLLLFGCLWVSCIEDRE